jgi:hypothetical protein
MARAKNIKAVRQILIPPFGGSNPPAPASQSGLSGQLRERAGNAGRFAPFAAADAAVRKMWPQQLLTSGRNFSCFP